MHSVQMSGKWWCEGFSDIRCTKHIDSNRDCCGSKEDVGNKCIRFSMLAERIDV